MPSYEGFEKCVSLCETRSPVNVFKRYGAVTWFPYCQFSFRCLSHGARRFDLMLKISENVTLSAERKCHPLVDDPTTA